MKDFGIFLIKPDGVNQSIQLECEHEIQQHGIEIIAKKICQLSPSDIKKYFYYQLPVYSEYMCSGPVIAYLLSAENLDIDRELFHVKNEIRKRHSVCGRDLKNLVHASHCGTEYFWQRKLFFSEYEKTEYTSYADMIVDLPDYSIETIIKAKNIIEASCLEKICVNLPFKDFDIYKDLIENYFSKEDVSFLFSVTIELPNNTCNLYCYCPQNYKINQKDAISEISNNKRLFIALGEIQPVDYNINVQEITEFTKYVTLYDEKIGYIFTNVYHELVERGIHVTGIVVNTSNMGLVEAETRYEVMQHLGLSFIGGSHNWESLGLFGISKTKFNESKKV